MTKAKAKVKEVMKEYKEGKLHSGAKKGPVVKKKSQAIAIALSEAKSPKKNSKSKLSRSDDVNQKYPTLEFVGKVLKTDLNNGKRKPEDEAYDKFAEKAALKEARHDGMKEKKRVNYFAPKSMKKKKGK